MGLTSVELLIDISPMRISYSGNVIAYGYTDSLSAKNIYNSLNIIVNLYSLKSYPYFYPCRPHRAKHPFAGVPHPRAGLARWCRDSYAMLATSLLSSPRPTGGVGPWIYRNGSARTRAKIFDFCCFYRLPLHIACVISTTAPISHAVRY